MFVRKHLLLLYENGQSFRDRQYDAIAVVAMTSVYSTGAPGSVQCVLHGRPGSCTVRITRAPWVLYSAYYTGAPGPVQCVLHGRPGSCAVRITRAPRVLCSAYYTCAPGPVQCVLHWWPGSCRQGISRAPWFLSARASYSTGAPVPVDAGLSCCFTVRCALSPRSSITLL